MNLTRAENEILARILDIPGLTLHVLKSAMYRLRKQSGKCITAGCGKESLPNKVRCEHCQELNRQYASNHRRRTQPK